MKKTIITLIAVLFSTFSIAQNAPTIGQVFGTVADMKKQVGSSDLNSVVYLVGGTTASDYRGGFYRWNSTSTIADDATYFNSIQVTGVTTGRWEKINQTVFQLPQGMLFRIGALSILAVSGTTNSSGEFTVNATFDNTSGGTAIFNSILYNATMATTASASPNDAVNGTIKSVTNNKVIVYRYTKGNVLGVLGAVAIVAAGSNVPVQCFIVGT